jgi:tripartite-type tricarboxylate transporter receptor subunit TctC
VLAVKNDLPVKNYAEFMQMAKAQPGRLNYASFGVGSMPQLNMEAFKAKQSVNLTHVPYKGGAQAVAGLLTGEVDVALLTAPSLLGPMKSGKVRALAIGSPKRSALLPDVPTLKESGIDVEADLWNGLIAPAGTPQPVLNKIHRAVSEAIHSKDVKDKLAVQLMEPVGNTPAEFKAQIDSDLARWAPVIKQAGIKVN